MTEGRPRLHFWLSFLFCSVALARESVTVPKRFDAQFIRRAKLPKGDKVLCLTFDDGPLPGLTEKILATLKEHKVKATFFLVGRNVKAHPELARAIVEGGHAIGSHSFTHARSLTKAQARKEIADTGAAIRAATGVAPSIFRPPYGLTTSALSTAAKEKKMPVILWSISSADTVRIDAKTIEHNILHTPYSGDIILMHDAGGADHATLKALPGILTGIKKMDFRCVTIPELLMLWSEQLANGEQTASPSRLKGKSQK